MAKAGRPFLNASRRRVEILDGTANKTMSTSTGDSSPQGGTSGTTLESGETYIIITDTDTDSGRTITLPPASKGAWVKIIYAARETGNWWKVVAQAGEFLNGQVFHWDVNAADYSKDIVAAAGLLNGTNDLSITYTANMYDGTYLTFISDGSEWYSMENHSIGSPTQATVATS